MSSAERPPLPDDFLVAVTARHHPDAPAIVHREGETIRTITYAGLDRRSAAVARALAERGLRPGDRVALRPGPGVDSSFLLMAIIRAGIVAVPVSTRLPEASLPAMLERIRCRHLILPSATPPPRLNDIDVLAADDLLAAGDTTPTAPPLFDPAGDATIIFTSGSTGQPKAALHSYANHWYSAAGSNRNILVGPGDRWLLSLPLWHVGGIAILFRAFLGGGAVAVPGRGASLAEAIVSLGVSHVSLVATQLLRLLRDPAGADAVARLKAILLGGGATPPSLIEEADRRKVPLVTSYGSTEMSSQVTAGRPGDPAELLMTSGRPLPFRECAIAPDGEILVRGETLFRGYVDEDGLRPARDPSGWFHTGDVGRIDHDGYLHVAGRRDQMFISGGENIHPEEIERELGRYPGIVEAVVVPVDDAEFGARPVAFLRSEDGTLPPPDALDAFLRNTLPGFKVPDRYLPWPATEEGMKPSRSDLAARARSSD